MGKDTRQDRAERRRKLAEAARERALRLSRPSPLPPHPEGLRPRVWPALAGLAAVALSFFSILAAVIATGAVLAYAMATRDNKKNALLWTYIQGRKQFMEGDYEAALANFEDMEEAGFSPPAVLRGIGLTDYQLGRWAEAATYLEDIPDRSAEETVAMAHSLVELGEYKEAEGLLAGLKEPPPTAGVVRAVTALKLDRPGEAVTVLDGLLAVAGGEGAPAEEPYLGARYWLGQAHLKAGDKAKAKEVFEGLYDLDPSYHDVAALLGRK